MFYYIYLLVPVKSEPSNVTSLQTPQNHGIQHIADDVLAEVPKGIGVKKWLEMRKSVLPISLIRASISNMEFRGKKPKETKGFGKCKIN